METGGEFCFEGLKKAVSYVAGNTKVLGVSHNDIFESVSGGAGAAGILGGAVGALTVKFIELALQAIQVAIQKLKEFAQESVATASDIQEFQNVIDVVFETDRVTKWAEEMSSAFNMSTAEAMQFAGTMGSLLTPTGLGIDTIEDMSIVLTQLSGDLGSLWNKSNEEAFNALKSAIAGEMEPMKQFGVVMSVANLEAYALSEGVDKSWQSMWQAGQERRRHN